MGRHVTGIRNKQAVALLLSCALVTLLGPSLSDWFFRSEASDAVVERCIALVQSARPKGDFPLEEVVRLQHGGQVGAGRKFSTETGYTETRQRVLARLQANNVTLAKVRSGGSGFHGCIGDLQFGLQYHVVENQAMYYVRVVQDQSAIRPLGC